MCGDTVKVLVNANQTAGNYSITWNGDDSNGNTVVDGKYIVHLILNDGEWAQSQNILVIWNDYEHLEMVEGQLGYTEIINEETQQDTFYTHNYHAMTDEDGYFAISLDCLPFGVEQIGVDESGNPTGTWSIPYKTKLWIVHGSNSTFETEWYDVDSNTGLSVEIQVP